VSTFPLLVFGPIVAVLALQASAASSASGVPVQAPGAQRATCAASSAGTRIRLSLVAEPGRRSDSTVRVALCLGAPPSKPAIGSFRAVIAYDSAAIYVASAAAGKGTPVVFNAKKAGYVEVAAASPGGIRQGELLTLTLRPRTRGGAPMMRLDLVEISSTKGANLLSDAQTVSLGPAACTARAESSVQITSLAPTTAEAGSIAPIAITGCGFDPADNTVAFGEVVFRNVRSTANGTRITINAPTEIPSRGEVAPMAMAPGSYQITVRTARGQSNVMVFTLR
jgi:hypothetical protein